MKDQREIIIPDLDYQAEVRKCKTMEDVVGKNGLMQKLFKDIIQQLLEAEMEEHLGRERHERSNEANPNYRNGYSSKTIESSFGEVGLDIPRDRKAQFEPKVVKKYETVCNELDKKIIGLYACGMSVRDIQYEMEELYGIDVSPAMISKITDKVVEAAAEWQSRELDEIYPIVYMNAMHFKVRDDNKIIEAYRIPILDYSVQMTEEERRTIRENLIQEQLEKITENIIKPGYQKYLYRKSKKNTEINQEDFVEDEEYEVTEKKVRIMKLDRKRHY